MIISGFTEFLSHGLFSLGWDFVSVVCDIFRHCHCYHFRALLIRSQSLASAYEGQWLFAQLNSKRPHEGCLSSVVVLAMDMR